VATILQRQGLAGSQGEAERLAAFSGGSVARALEYGDAALWTFRGQLLRALAETPLQSRALSVATTAFIEAAGKEASERRVRARQVLEFAIAFWQTSLRRASGVTDAADEELADAVAARLMKPVAIEALEAALERTLEAAEQVDRNANQTTLVECWLDDLARIVDRNGWRSLPAA
jgi:hypothetical protein